MLARFHVPLLVVSASAAIGATALTVLVAVHPLLPIDAAIEQDVQSIDLGALSGIFSFYTLIGGPMTIIAEAALFTFVLLFNRPAWRLLIAASFASAWYFLLSSVVIRPRPWVPEVPRVTEHLSRSSYPSGHMILFVFYAAVLMLCLGYKFLPRNWVACGWAAAALFVIVGGLSRMYSGAHWPSDLLAGIFIGVSWISLMVAIRWISDPALQRPEPAGSRPRGTPLAAS